MKNYVSSENFKSKLSKKGETGYMASSNSNLMSSTANN